MPLEPHSRLVAFAFILHASVAGAEERVARTADAFRDEAEPLSIVVESGRDVGCPGAAELALRVRPLHAGAGDAPLPRIEIRYARDRGDFVATLTIVGPEPRVRTLRSPGPTCEALANNLTASLALVLDQPPSHIEDLPSAETPAFQSPPSVSTQPLATSPLAAQAPLPQAQDVPDPDHPKARSATESTSLHLVGGPALTFGLAREALAAGALGMGIRQGRLSLWILGFASAAATEPPGSSSVASQAPSLPPSEVQPDAPEASVNVRFGGGQVRGCATLMELKALECSACLLGAAAALRIEASGFASDASALRSWHAAGAGLVLATPLGPSAGAALEALAFSPLHQRVVFQETVVFETPSAGIWLGISGRVQVL